ncbi:MAG: YkvA family protein, partial [bacterium]
AIPLILTLPKHIKLISRLMGDSRILLLPKVLFIASLVYLISPFDLIPDFLFPIIGWADDLFIVFAAARNLLRAAPGEVLCEHVEAIQRG